MNLRPSSLAFAACLTALPALAEPIFLVHNEATLSRTTALPKLGQASVLDPNEVSTHFGIDWSNEYVQRQNANESITLDGETGHFDWGLRYGLRPGVEIGIDVPLLVTGGGILDGAIERYHSAFGLPNGGREQVPSDRYRFQYTRNGQTLLDRDQGAQNLGDIELSTGIAVTSALALRALVKLPTGSTRELTGGNLGSALWIDYDPFGDSSRWFGFVSGGVSYNESSRLLPAQQEQVVGLLGLGAGYRAFRRVALLAQFYGHTALYKDSGLNALTRPGGQLVFGTRIGVAPHLSVDVAAQEDVSINSSPDFGIHVGLNYH